MDYPKWVKKEVDFWNTTTVAPEQTRLEQTKFMILPPPKPPPVKMNYMFQMEVMKPTEPMWLSIWRRKVQKDLVADLQLYEQQQKLLFCLCQIAAIRRVP